MIYYISPQGWAWKESRVKLIKKVVDKMIAILPFEKEFYALRSYKVDYVGHPLVQVITEFQQRYTPGRNYPKPVVALLPGSRRQEVAVKLPIMLQASKRFPERQFVVAKAASLDDAFYDVLLKDYPAVQTVRNETYALLSQAVAALVTSGTATLETALFGVPQVVCYKGSAVSYQIARRLVKIKYISLVNLIMDKPVVTELIQHELTEENVRRELHRILFDEKRVRQIKEDYTALKNLLQQGGNASEKAARIIIEFLQPATSS